MRDERVEKMARLLAEYCIGAGEGDEVLIEGSSTAEPLVKELYVRLLLRGAIPIPLVDLPDTEELFFEHAKDIHYRKTPPAVWALNERADAFITIMAPTNTRALAGIDPSKQQALAKRDEDLQAMVERKDRWVLTLFPTEARAQEAGMGLAEYEEFVFAAMALGEEDPVCYWREKARERDGLIKRMEGTREVRICGAGTDLTLSVKCRQYVNDDFFYYMA